MEMPTITVVSANLTRVEIEGVTCWFSYSTCVAFSVGGVLVCQVNVWGQTTGKHLNAIQSDHSKRVDYTTFQRQWRELTSTRA